MCATFIYVTLTPKQVADVTTVELALTLLARRRKKIPMRVDKALLLVVLAVWYWEEQFGTWVVGTCLVSLGGKHQPQPSACRLNRTIFDSVYCPDVFLTRDVHALSTKAHFCASLTRHGGSCLFT